MVRAILDVDEPLAPWAVSGLLALTSRSKSLMRIRVSLRLVKIVTINKQQHAQAEQVPDEVAALLRGSFLSGDFGWGVGVGFGLSMNDRASGVGVRGQGQRSLLDAANGVPRSIVC